MWVKTIDGDLVDVSKAFCFSRSGEIVLAQWSCDDLTISDGIAVENIDALYKKLTFGGWVEDTKGVLRNLKMAHKIEVGTSAGKSRVYATFALSNKTNDPAFYEMATLATFDDEADAKKYLAELKELMNGVN